MHICHTPIVRFHLRGNQMTLQHYSAADARDFESIFHVPLKDYWHGPLLGFDITGFDDRVIKSGTMSVRDAVCQTYGYPGVVLVQRLLGIQR